MSNLDLFTAMSVAVMPTLQERVSKVIETLLSLIRTGTPMILAYSGGKDSAVVSALTLMAAKIAVEEGLTPIVVANTSNTYIENPEIERHYKVELAKMEQYGRKHGFKVTTAVVTPSLASRFQVKVLTGRGMPSFAGQNTDCSIDLKQAPAIAWRREFFRSLERQGLPEPVTLLGTRYDESMKRKLSMLSRQESDRAPVRNKAGDLVLSPVAYWMDDDVWEFIGEAAAGSFGPCYSDFEETKRIYAHSSSTSCAVVADALASGKVRGGCGARHGCWACQQSQDKSMENLLAYDPRYEYMRGLNRLNKFLHSTRWDWSRRHWIGRTIKAGWIAIEPDTYHPRAIRELARFMLQLDHDESERAHRKGEYPRFKILDDLTLIALDALWSLNGLARPFAIWKDVRDIRSGEVRYDIPDLPEVAQTPMPPAKFLFVGQEWDDSAHFLEWTGMRDPMIDGLAECGPELREINGNWVWDVPHAAEFEVDVEGAAMLLDFEMDRLLELAEGRMPPGGITAGYKHYLHYGVLTLSHSQVAKHDEILRRTAFKDRMGLTMEYDVEALRNRAVDFRDLPPEARKAWGRKASSESAQAELLAA